MRLRIWLILAIAVIVISLVLSPLGEWAGMQRGAAASEEQSGWHLVFEDDFNGGALDERKWSTAFPWGRDRSSVGELQYYAPDAFEVNGGKLKIIAKPTSRSTHDYDSGLISSHESFTTEFGRFEIRAKMPQGKGLWPAFWLLPTTEEWPPEIDVLEVLGDETDTVHMHAHWLQNGKAQQDGEEYTGPDFSRDYHTFAVEWTDTSITWFVDGVKRHKLDGKSPSEPMYLLANLAVGGDWPGSPDASTQFPATFDIDYIRAYEGAPAPDVKDTKGKSPKEKHKKRRKHKRNRHRAGKRVGPENEE